MEEVLYRGKRIDNGEWIEGYYAAEPYTKSTYNYGYILENEKDLYAKKAYLVDSRTVGQFIGLTDKNGRKIFEGDIVKLFDIHVGEIVQECSAFGISCRQQIDYDYLASEIASVTGYDNTPMFCYNDNFVSLWELYWNYNDENDEISVVEVIGNIHDNSELLGGRRMTKYIHYGSKIFDTDRFEQISNFFIKPKGGLWASRVDSEFGWKEWNEDNKFAECNIDNSFTFTLKSNAKVIELFRDDDLLKLPRFNPTFPTISNYYLIDYEECIRQRIDAIEVRDISKGLYWSLYGYDCECILILNPDIVEVYD